MTTFAISRPGTCCAAAISWAVNAGMWVRTSYATRLASRNSLSFPRIGIVLPPLCLISYHRPRFSVRRVEGTLLEAPGKDASRRDFDDHRFRLLERGLVRIMRILPVQERARLAEARPALEQPDGSPHHDAFQMRPGVGIEVDGDRRTGVGFQVDDLLRVGRRPEIELAVGEDVADRHDVWNARRVGGRHAADALLLDERCERLLEPHCGLLRLLRLAARTAAGRGRLAVRALARGARRLLARRGPAAAASGHASPLLGGLGA